MKSICKGRILIVSGTNAAFQNSVKACAGKMGYVVDTATDSASGLKKLLAKEFCLVLVSEHLPDTTGMKLLQNFISIKPETHVVAVTKGPVTNKKDAFIRAGASGCMTENFDPREFETMVSRLCQDFSLSREQQKKRGFLIALLLSIPLWLIIAYLITQFL
jgi:DNA-binding NtrC family response regulator